MQQHSRSHEPPSPSLMHRLDRMFGEINALLIVVALGLAVLDFTCFVAFRAVDSITIGNLQLDTQSADQGAGQPQPRPAGLGRQ